MPAFTSGTYTDSAAGLLTSADFLLGLLQQITQPFFLTDEHGSFLLWNRAFETLSGYSTAELVKMQSPQLIAPESESQSAVPVEPAGGVGEPRTWTTQLRQRAGDSIPVELRLVPLLSPDGDPVHLILAVNLSERQQLEAELRQSQKMEAIGRLAGGIAHDFNNVLTTILGLTESMITGRTAPSSEALREIQHAGTHAADLTRSLLAFSRRQILQMKIIRLESVVQNVAKMIARLIGEDIRLEISMAPKLPPIRADQAQIEQVLLNLCLNARDAMPKGGELTIETKLETVDEAWCKEHKGAKPGSYVVLSVRDTGEGMDEETLHRVFEPFFTKKEQGKGTGLGLAMVYGIVKQHEGFIHLESKVNAGTNFCIYFPASSGEPEQKPSAETVTSKGGSATILVVEDEKSVRRLVMEVLANLGYRTFAAANGEEAVKVFERWADQIDLVLLDAILPKRGARDVYDQIRARKPSVRFLFTSGYNEVFINKKFELDPSFLFLRKPFTTQELSKMIQTALQ